MHVEAIKLRGHWMNGVIDPAARGRPRRTANSYSSNTARTGCGLASRRTLSRPVSDEVWTRMVTGRFKWFRTCSKWLEEYRLYRRDDKGNVVKENDHLMDATRYWS